MKVYLEAREAYALFLESEFWQRLSQVNKIMNRNRCQRCGSGWELQSHHRVYREHWFDTKLEDLECLCRRCHEKRHGVNAVVGAPEWPEVFVPRLQMKPVIAQSGYRKNDRKWMMSLWNVNGVSKKKHRQRRRGFHRRMYE